MNAPTVGSDHGRRCETPGPRGRQRRTIAAAFSLLFAVTVASPALARQPGTDPGPPIDERYPVGAEITPTTMLDERYPVTANAVDVAGRGVNCRPEQAAADGVHG